ncbi:hypothetical protein BGZ65_011023, partial [Modicella reniformis]
MLAIASGDVYDPSSKKSFDVSDLLSAGYAVHSSATTQVDVVPLPTDLQARLERAYDNEPRTNYHGKPSRGNPLKVIEVRAGNECGWPFAHDAGAHDSGSDVHEWTTLLRILLRIQLAPGREERIQERAKTRTFSGQHELEASGTPKLKIGQWRRRVLDLTDELTGYVSDGLSRHRDRVVVVLDKLEAMEKIRPTRLQKGFDSIEVQYAKLVEETRTTDQPQAAVLGQDASSLDGDDDE